jgi:hypothetical protein
MVLLFCYGDIKGKDRMAFDINNFYLVGGIGNTFYMGKGFEGIPKEEDLGYDKSGRT